MSAKVKKLIEDVMKGRSPASVARSITEVQVKADPGYTTMVSDDAGKAREIVEKHFKAMSEELEQAGIKGFRATVSESYGNVSFGCC